MIEVQGNLFLMEADAICITTNGYTKANGDAVIGRGCAKQAAEVIRTLPTILGEKLRLYGNQTQILLTHNNVALVALPVKPQSSLIGSIDEVVKHMQSTYRPLDTVPGWACKALLPIIERSILELVYLADEQQWSKVVLPRPGCGAGELDYSQVKPILEEYLDDRFLVTSRNDLLDQQRATVIEQMTINMRGTTAFKHLNKEIAKVTIANKFIGQGVGSTGKHAQAWDLVGLTNVNYYASDDVIMLAANGRRHGAFLPIINGELQGAYKLIDKAIKAKATFITDTQEHLNSNGYNTGEQALTNYLEYHGYTSTGIGLWVAP